MLTFADAMAPHVIGNNGPVTSDHDTAFNSEDNAATRTEFWRTQLVEPASCLSTLIQKPADGLGSFLKHTATHRLRTPEDQCSVTNLISALALVSMFSGTGHEAGLALRVGCTASVIPLRVVRDSISTLGQFREKLETNLVSAIEYSAFHLPSLILDALMSKSPQFCVVLELASPWYDYLKTAKWGGSMIVSQLKARYSLVQTEEAQLSLRLALDKDGAVLEATYVPANVSTPSVKALLFQLDDILLQITRSAAPRFLEELQCVSHQGLKQIMSWNAGNNLPPMPTACTHDIVSAWARKTPGAEAIDSWDARLSFDRLDWLSSALARYLERSCGVVEGDIVPILMDRSALAVVCMLGIMKTGAAFVCLDPTSPKERNYGIVETCQAKQLVVAERHNTLRSDKAVIVSLDLLSSLALAFEKVVGEMKPLPTVTSDKLAYIVFTSGSTGRPKGVMIEHGSLAYSLGAHGGDVYRQGPTSRVLQFASLAFDASMTEHLGPLSNGACVCIPDAETRLSDITSFINSQRVDWAFFTPSFFKLLKPRDVPGLKTVVLGGEAITTDCIEMWASKIRLINGYGPSEGTIVATASVVNCNASESAAPSIGRGITCKTWVVNPDDANQLLPIGSIGELVLQGPAVSRGYLNDVAKTRASFVNVPWSNLSEDDWGSGRARHREAVYKTGDLVRYQSDGSLCYLGRKDTQVKVRGQRLELSEVEHHMPLDKIQHAAAFLPKSGAYAQTLVVVFTLQMSETNGLVFKRGSICLVNELNQDRGTARRAQVAVEEAKAFLAKTVPIFAVPDVWLQVQYMPVNTSGKMDRNRLTHWLESLEKRQFESVRSPNHTTGCLAESEAETIIQDAWSFALGVKPAQIHLDRSFQSYGGDSIRAVQVLSRCKSCKVQFNIRSILAGASVRELASESPLRQTVVTNTGTQLDMPFPLTPIQKVYTRHMPSEPHYFNQRSVLRLKKAYKPTIIQWSLEQLVKSHPMLRVRLVEPEAARVQQIITKESQQSLLFKHHTTNSLEGARTIFQADQSRIDVRSGPILVASMVEVAEGSSYTLLSLIISHFSIDIVSWNIIMEDLSSLLSTGQVLPSFCTSFQAWSMQQARDVQDIWSKQKSLIPYSHLKELDRTFWSVSPAQNTYGNVFHRAFSLGPDVASPIVKHCSSNSLSVLEPLLACLFLSFAKVFPGRDQDPLVIHSEGHGREPWKADQQDISRTVGWFTTLVPICIGSTTDDINEWHTACQIRHLRQKFLHGGVAHFASRFLVANPASPDADPEPMEVVFNYMGQQPVSERTEAFGELAEFRGESGDDASANMRRFSIFEISAEIRDGGLYFSFQWPATAMHQNKIQCWIEECRNSLSAAAAAPIRIPTGNVSLMPTDYSQSMALLQHAKETISVANSGSILTMCPASGTQRAMLLAQKTGASHCYQTRLAISVSSTTGIVNGTNLLAAWKQVVSRHVILRTVFVSRPHSPFTYDQAILDRVDAPGTLVSLAEASAKHSLVNLSDNPWLPKEYEIQHHFAVVEASGRTSRVILQCSHALIDHISLKIILRDLSDAYFGRAFAKAATPYSSVIAHIESAGLENGIAFWERLYSAPASGYVCPRHRTLSDTHASAHRIASTLEPGLAVELQQVCRRLSLTPAIIFRFAWAMLLSRHLQSPRVTFGHVVAGRDIDMPQIENAVGPCLNVLGCVAHVDDQTSVRNGLEALQTQFLESLPHQHAYQEFAMTRCSYTTPRLTTALFDTAINFRQHTEITDSESPRLEFTAEEEYDPFDVSLRFFNHVPRHFTSL